MDDTNYKLTDKPNLDSFVQLSIHKLSPLHPGLNIETDKTLIEAELVGVSKISQHVYRLKGNLFVNIRETMIFPYNMQELINQNDQGLNIFLKTFIQEDDNNVYAYMSVNLNKIIQGESQKIGPLWLPLQNAAIPDQIAAFILISATSARYPVNNHIEMCNGIDDDVLDSICLQETDIPGNIIVENASISMTLMDCEYVDKNLEAYNMEISYGVYSMKSDVLKPSDPICLYIELAVVLPFVHQSMTIRLTKDGKTLSILKKDVREFFCASKRKLFSLNFTDSTDGNLILRLLGKYEPITSRQSNPAFILCPINGNTLSVNEPKKEFKLVIDYISVINLDDFEGQDIILRLKWGASEQFSDAFRVKNGEIYVNKRYVLKSSFTFVDENLKKLPKPEINLLRPDKTQLFTRCLPIRNMPVISELETAEKMPYLPIVMKNPNNKGFRPISSGRVFLFEGKSEIADKPLISLSDKVAECYTMINIYSIASNKPQKDMISGKLTLKCQSYVHNVEIKEFRSFNWVNSKLVIKTNLNASRLPIFYFKLWTSDENIADLGLEYVSALEGVPQRYYLNENVTITLSMKLFTDAESFKAYSILHETLYMKTIKPHISTVVNSLAIPLKPDVVRYKLGLNIWKVDNFTNEIQSLALKNPVIGLNLLPIAMLGDDNVGTKQVVFKNKYAFPINPSFHTNILQSSEINFNRYIESEHKLPTDYRLLPKITLNFIEKSAQRSTSKENSAGDVMDMTLLSFTEIDLFKVVIENKMLLYKKLDKLHRILPSLEVRNKLRLMSLIESKIAQIHTDLNFDHQFKHKEYNLSSDESKRLFYRAILNVAKRVRIDPVKVYENDSKNLNCFYKLRNQILNELGSKTSSEKAQLNVHAIKSQLNSNLTNRSLNNINSFKSLKLNTIIADFGVPTVDKRTLTKYALDETTMRNPEEFVMKPMYMIEDGSKVEIHPPNELLYHRVGVESENNVHYRYKIPCSLESSVYFEDSASWNTYTMINYSNRRVADLRAKISITDNYDLKFFQQIEELGLDTKLIQLKNDQIFESFSPNERLKLRLYLLDFLLPEYRYSRFLHLHIKVDDKLLKDLDLDQYLIDNDGSLNFLETVEFNFKIGTAKLLSVGLVSIDEEFGTVKELGIDIIDLEQRYFNFTWISLPYKPIETRELRSATNNILAGECRLWLDIFRRSDTNVPPKFVLRNAQFNDVEVRLVVWKIEGINDLLADKTNQEITLQGELHPDNKTVKYYPDIQSAGSRLAKDSSSSLEFNHRMIWRYNSSSKSQILKLSAKNSYTNEMIDIHLDLSILTHAAVRNNNKMFHKRTNQDEDCPPSPDCSIHHQVTYLESSDGKCRVYITLEAMSATLADKNPVGLARNHPNIYPHIPAPASSVLIDPDTVRVVIDSLPIGVKFQISTYLFIFFSGFVGILAAVYFLCLHLLKYF